MNCKTDGKRLIWVKTIAEVACSICMQVMSQIHSMEFFSFAFHAIAVKTTNTLMYIPSYISYVLDHYVAKTSILVLPGIGGLIVFSRIPRISSATQYTRSTL